MRLKTDRKMDFALDVVFVLICCTMVLPFLLLIAVSFSNEKDVMLHGYKLIPEHFDLTAYKFVFRNASTVIKAYVFTFITSISSTFLGVILMSLMAYPLSVRTYKFRRFFALYLFVTMVFSGGMAAGYIVYTRYYHFRNSIWVFILPGCISAWHVILIRTFFQGIPTEISEAAKIDGASHLRIFFEIVLPLSKPVLATVALMQLLAHWNDWMTSMLYTTEPDMRTIQYLLQQLMESVEKIRQMQQAGVSVDLKNLPSETIRMAMAVVAAGPMIAIFPFFQKYFTKGITVGSVKG